MAAVIQLCSATSDPFDGISKHTYLFLLHINQKSSLRPEWGARVGFEEQNQGLMQDSEYMQICQKKVQRLAEAHLKDFGWQELQNTFPADLYHQMGGTDSGGINEIFLNNRINSYNWLLVEIDIFVKIVVYPNFYIKFSYFSVVLVGKTFVLVVSNNQFNTQIKFETIIPSWWGFIACQSKLGACKLAHITHFFLTVLRTLIRKLALMKSGQMSVFWIFFIKNSKNTIISYIYNCFMTIFYKKTCLESGLKYSGTPQ